MIFEYEVSRYFNDDSHVLTSLISKPLDQIFVIGTTTRNIYLMVHDEILDRQHNLRMDCLATGRTTSFSILWTCLDETLKTIVIEEMKL